MNQREINNNYRAGDIQRNGTNHSQPIEITRIRTYADLTLAIKAIQRGEADMMPCATGCEQYRPPTQDNEGNTVFIPGVFCAQKGEYGQEDITFDGNQVQCPWQRGPLSMVYKPAKNGE